jgi:hypothetical protein
LKMGAASSSHGVISQKSAVFSVVLLRTSIVEYSDSL